MCTETFGAIRSEQELFDRTSQRVWPAKPTAETGFIQQSVATSANKFCKLERAQMAGLEEQPDPGTATRCCGRLSET